MQLRKIHIGLVPILALILMPILSLYSIVSWLSIGNVVVLVIFFARLVFYNKGKLKVRSFSIFLFWVILAAYNFLVSILNQGNAVAMSNSVVILLFGIEIALIDNSGISIEMIYPIAKCITSIVVFFFGASGSYLLYNRNKCFFRKNIAIRINGKRFFSDGNERKTVIIFARTGSFGYFYIASLFICFDKKRMANDNCMPSRINTINQFDRSGDCSNSSYHLFSIGIRNEAVKENSVRDCNVRNSINTIFVSVR